MLQNKGVMEGIRWLYVHMLCRIKTNSMARIADFITTSMLACRLFACHFYCLDVIKLLKFLFCFVISLPDDWRKQLKRHPSVSWLSQPRVTARKLTLFATPTMSFTSTGPLTFSHRFLVKVSVWKQIIILNNQNHSRKFSGSNFSKLLNSVRQLYPIVFC